MASRPSEPGSGIKTPMASSPRNVVSGPSAPGMLAELASVLTVTFAGLVLAIVSVMPTSELAAPVVPNVDVPNKMTVPSVPVVPPVRPRRPFPARMFVRIDQAPHRGITVEHPLLQSAARGRPVVSDVQRVGVGEEEII